MASTLCACTHAHPSHKAKDLELSQVRNRPCTPRTAASPAASLATASPPALPSTRAAPQGMASCWIIRLDWQTRNRQAHAKERGRERHQELFRSAAKEPTPNLISRKTRKEKLLVMLTQMHSHF